MYKYVIIFLITIGVKAQNNTGIITYQKKYIDTVILQNKKLVKKQDARTLKLNKAIKEAHKYLKFHLFFNQKEGLFESQKFLDTPRDRLLKLFRGVKGRGIHYNTNTERLSQLDFYGQDFLISYNKITWVLENKTKKIGNYTCFKATAIDSFKTRSGIKKYIVTAWYTPQINTSFGPIGFSGTPGLILELERNNIKYFATKIVLNPKKKVTIKKPSKGIKITDEELRDMLIGSRKNFKKL